MLVAIIFSVLLICKTNQNHPDLIYKIHENSDLNVLSQIQLQIQKLSMKQEKNIMKFSRLNQHILKKMSDKSIQQRLDIIPSISIPYKGNINYHMMIKINHSFYNLRGEIIYKSPSNKTILTSIRNEHTYFSQINTNNNTIIVNKLKIINKKIEIVHQINLQLSSSSSSYYNLIIFYHSGQINYVLSNHQGKILFFDKTGKMYKQINLVESIVQIEKVGNNIVVMTQNTLFFLEIMNQLNKKSCDMPLQSIFKFIQDQSNYKYIYGQTHNKLYKIQLSKECKIIKQYNILQNSLIFPTSNILFIQYKQIRYYINMTDDTMKTYILPLSQCEDVANQEKIYINRKFLSHYIISQVCVEKQYYKITHVLVQLDDKADQMAHFSKFRIPLLLLSFGVIIYITMKNKSNNSQKQQKSDRQIEQQIIKKLSSFQDRNTHVQQSYTKSRISLNNFKKEGQDIQQIKKKQN